MGNMSDTKTALADKLLEAKSPSLPLAEVKVLLSAAWAAREDAREALRDAETIFDGILSALFARTVLIEESEFDKPTYLRRGFADPAGSR